MKKKKNPTISALAYRDNISGILSKVWPVTSQIHSRDILQIPPEIPTWAL